VSRVEEEGSRQGTTSDDIIASHISGAEEAAPEVPVSSVEQADADRPTSDESGQIFFSWFRVFEYVKFSFPSSIFWSVEYFFQLHCYTHTSSDVVEHAARPKSLISGLKEAAGKRVVEYSSSRYKEVARTAGKWYRCTLQNLTNQWKLDAHLTGLKKTCSKNFGLTAPNIELEVLMEPSVLLNNSLTLKILNLKFHSDNYGSNAGAGILSQFFLSGVALTVTPEVDLQHFMFTKLGLGSANPAYDRLFGTTLGISATVLLGKGVPTVGFTSTQTISCTSKSVTDWKHEQTHGTQNKHSSKSGTFSWTLKSLGGIPFDKEKPSYPRSLKKYRFELPFNEDGSVTFTDKEYPDPITWSFKPELEGTMVAWHIAVEVYVTILNNSRFTSAGKTLKFGFARQLQHKLSTDLMRTSLVLQ